MKNDFESMLNPDLALLLDIGLPKNKDGSTKKLKRIVLDKCETFK